MRNKKLRTLLIDLETSPTLAYVWQMYEADVLKVVKPWNILCFSYKWLGEKTTKVESLPNFKSEKQLVQKLWGLFEEADIIIGHNGDKFDIKKSNAKFIEHGLTPPEPYKTIDTLKIARRHFRFDSNRLDALGEYLGVGRKIKTGGFDLWDRCMNGDLKAFKLMEKYNKQDVVLLEKVYYKLRPWMENHPNLNVLDNKLNSCPKCKSKRIQSRGFGFSSTGKRQRYVCLDCGGWSAGGLIKTDIKIK